MDIEFFREFIVLAEYENFTKAADALYITQSSLSKHLKASERELGVPLIVKDSRKFLLTEYGMKFLAHAKAIVAIQDTYLQEAEEAKEVHKVVRIVCHSVVERYGIMDHLLRYGEQHSRLTLNITTFTESFVKNILLNEGCELAIVTKGNLEGIPGLAMTPLYTDRMCLILPKDHPLARRQEVDIRELQGETFIRRASASAMTEVFNKACKAAGFLPEYSREVVDAGINADIRFLEKGRVIRYGMRRASEVDFSELPQFELVDISPPIYLEIGVGYKKKTIEDPDIQALVEYLKECSEADGE